MKGMIFTEFLEMVEDSFGWEMAENIIEDAKLPNDGAYTAVGTYDHAELVRLVVALSKRSEVSVPDLMRIFGRHAFGRFVVGFPFMFEGVSDPLAFLDSVENHIHVEVRKLYPAAELPTFNTSYLNDDCLTMEYRSERPFADFAEGLIQGCIQHFGQEIKLERSAESDHGRAATFTLTRMLVPEGA